MRELKNAKVTHVSYVDKAANKKKFFLTKSEDQPNDFEKEVRLVTKADDPQKLVYGVVYEPDKEDAHGDFMTAETIEKAAHGFMENYQLIDKQHDFETEAGKVVESYVAPVDLEIDSEKIAKGTWVLVTKATDDMWESIQKGEFTGYSLAGSAETETVEKATQDRFNRGKTYRDVNAALDAFRGAAWSILDNYDDSDADKIAGIQSEISELSALIGTIQTTKSVTKQGFGDMVKSFFNTKKQEEKEMTGAELKKALDEALKPFNDRLEKLEKQDTGDADGKVTIDVEVDTEKAKESISDLAAVIEKAVAPLNEKIEKLEKARNSNVVEQTYTEEIVKADLPNYVTAAFPISE